MRPISTRPLWSLHQLVVAFVVGSASVVPASGAEARFARGDANGDLSHDIADPTFALNALFAGGAPPPCLDAADANDDGGIDVSDPVYLLNWLFAGGAAPPAPFPVGRCGGEDPTPDALGCAEGIAGGNAPPALTIVATRAPPPGVRERSRTLLPAADLPGADHRVEAGTSFALLVVAAANETTAAAVLLAEPDEPSRPDVDSLRVVCDRDLGDPARGGVAAGVDLAARFLGAVDVWSDPIYLEEHAALIIAGDSPLAPAPGFYRFTARAVASDCSESEPAEVVVEVLESHAPRIDVWVAAGTPPEPTPLSHHPGSGSPRITPGQGVSITIDLRPNGRALDVEPDPESLRVVASPPFIGGDEDGDLTSRLQRDPAAAWRWTLRVDPGVLFPAAGNTRLRVTGAGGSPPASVQMTFTLEVPVSHALEIQPVWDVNCSGCHEGPGANKGLVLVAPGEPPERLWRRIVNVFAAEPAITSTAPLLIRPFHPERSYLYHKLTGTHREPEVEGQGGRMPLGGPPYLDDATTTLLRSWIEQGAAR